MLRSITRRERLITGFLACLMAMPGCVGIGLSQPDRFDYFTQPAPTDPWSGKIHGWQRREQADRAHVLGAVPPVAGVGADASSSSDLADGEPSTSTSDDGAPKASDAVSSLRAEYAGFLARQKRTAAREFAEWVQSQAKQHYIADGAIDHWATLEETFRSDGEDCDGLELLAFHGLRALGFDEERVFRSIVYRPSDGQHHMVTLWFEDPDDPWVIDPTGAMIIGMHRMSQIPGWVPLKVFTESEEFTVERATNSRGRALAKAN